MSHSDACCMSAELARLCRAVRFNEYLWAVTPRYGLRPIVLGPDVVLAGHLPRAGSKPALLGSHVLKFYTNNFNQ